ncbi:GWT1-domain-containing protein [Dentipellis sp. KUC8613]|nr:GWT1-domain-containing protein [Dentipellis sp. KUC8613]
MDADYKASKEAFVSGMTGSSVLHVNLISANLIKQASIALHSAIRTRFPSPSQLLAFPAEWLTLVAPLILSITLFADHPTVLILLLVAPTALLLLLIPPRESGTPLPSNSPQASPSVPSRVLRTKGGTDTLSIAPLPALSTYRAHMMLMTVLGILAVDFPVFPRALAKCETYGVSIMDLGVGSFVFSQGVVSAIPLLKDPQYLTSSSIPKIQRTLKKCIPVLLLGLVRVLLVKGTEYPEHVTEYGVHWNFFLTLGFIPVLQVLLHPFIRHVPISLIGLLLALGQQLVLSSGLRTFVFDAPRVGLISANKEGIVSLPGYLAIHLLGLSTGTFLLPPSPSYFRRRQRERPLKRRDSTVSDLHTGKPVTTTIRRENDKTAIELFSYAFIWWTLFFACRYFRIDDGVSRRLVNLQYILWVSAFNTSFILGYLTLDLAFFPSPLLKSVYSPTSKLKVPAETASASALLAPPPAVQAPPLLEAINRNGLPIFLLANMATGVVNLSMETMYASDAVAMGVLTLYAVAVCAVAWWTRDRRLWKL